MTETSNLDSWNDLSAALRQQTFASDGDAIFMPGGMDNIRGSKNDNPFQSVPTVPLANPFSTAPSTVSGSTPSTSQQSSFRGTSSMLRHDCSPTLSADSASVLSQSRNGSFVQVEQAFTQQTNKQHLPCIPNIQKEHGSAMNANAAHVPSPELLFQVKLARTSLENNPKLRRSDVLMKISVHIKSGKANTMNTSSTHIVQKWYTDLGRVHEHLGLSVHGIAFPSLGYGSNNQEQAIPEGDSQKLQNYLNTVCESILNMDSRSQVAQTFLASLDDEAKSLSDKIRMIMLESRLIDTMNRFDLLQTRMINVENRFNESTNLVYYLKQKLEQRENPSRRSSGIVSGSEHSKQGLYNPQPASTPGSYTDTPVLMQNVPVRSASFSGVVVPSDNINPSQLIGLAETVLNEKGPLPVGEVGKMLQEATGNPSLSQVLKERHNGLKKFLEKFSDKFIMSCDHPFNPHVYLRRSYSPDEQRLIENGSTAFLDKKVKKPRRKDNKKHNSNSSWPNSVSSTTPTLGSYQQSRDYY